MPGWDLVVLAVLAIAAGVLAVIRGNPESAAERMLRMVVVGGLAVALGWALARVLDGDRRPERSEALPLELTARALAPGSALACLDGVAGEAVEEACEKALFATAESTAAAVSYVASQLALLAAGSDDSWKSEKSAGLLRNTLRRAIEADRFGIVAHVLALRGGCTPNHCSAFALLQDSTRVKTNLVRRPFEARVAKHMAAWSAPGSPPAPTEPAPAELSVAPAATKSAKGELYFPSADSIPPVNIMTAEPAARQPGNTTAEGVAQPRKPAAPSSSPPPSRQPPAADRSEPLQLAPNAQ